MDFSTVLNNINKSAEQIQSHKKEKRDYKDARFWAPSRGADGNGLAIVRLLPDIFGDVNLPYVEVIKYSFKIGNRWYINNSRRSLGDEEPDPVYELNGKLYQSGKDGNEEHAALAKRMNQQYRKVMNIQVIDDKQVPANNGKVFLFDSSGVVFEKITDANNPKDEYTAKVNPFHPVEGANMIIRVKSKDIGGAKPIPDYSDTGFLEKSAMCDGDEAKIMAVLKQSHNLVEFTKEGYYRPYDDLLDHLKYTVDKDFYNSVMLGSKMSASSAPVEDTPSKTMDATPTAKPEETTAAPVGQQTDLEQFIADTKAKMSGDQTKA